MWSYRDIAWRTLSFIDPVWLCVSAPPFSGSEGAGAETLTCWISTLVSGAGVDMCHLGAKLDFGLQLFQRVRCMELYGRSGKSGCDVIPGGEGRGRSIRGGSTDELVTSCGMRGPNSGMRGSKRYQGDCAKVATLFRELCGIPILGA